MFKKHEEVYSIKEFMNGYQREEKKIDTRKLKKAGLLPLAVVPFTHLKHTFASDGVGSALPVTASATGDIYVKVIHAFDPLVNIIQAFAYPVAMIVVLGGALFIMIGNKEKGFAMMQGAGLGYVLVQLTPMVLNILVSAMKSVS
jgi:hypothetical protein